MLRNILSVILAYVVIVLVTFVTLTIAWTVIGTEGAFQEGSWEPSTLWIAVMFILGLVAAVVGGYVCALVSRGSGAPKFLIGLVLVLGLLMAVGVMMAPPGEVPPREADVAMFEAMGNARQPVWVAVLNPIVGAVGIALGARFKGRPDAVTAAS